MWGGLFLVGALLLVVTAAVYQAPWRQFRSQNIDPLEADKATQFHAREKLLSELEDARWEVGLFDRDLRNELEAAKEFVRASHADMKPLKEEKAELHDEQEQASENLDDWHTAAAPSFFSKPRKIPQTSLLGSLGLGQTLDQRDRLKNRRDGLGAQIVDLKSDLDDIYHTRLKPAKDARDDAWRGLERMKQMRREGILRQHSLNRVASIQMQIDACDARITELEALVVSETARFYSERQAARAAAKAAKK